MICRLCLQDQSGVIKIFGKQGLELNIVGVLAKHFWFEPQADDPISTAICSSCWCMVSVFHKFYLNVEEAHRLLTERFSVISKRTNERISHASSTMFKNGLKCKLEVDDDEEVDLQINEILNSASRDNTPTPTDEINNEAHKSKPSHESVCEGASSSRGNETLTEEVHSIDLPKEDKLASPKKHNRRAKRSFTTLKSTGEINNEAQKSKPSHESMCDGASSSRGNETLAEEVHSLDMPKEDKLASPKKHNRRAKLSSTTANGPTSAHVVNNKLLSAKETAEANSGLIIQPKLTFDNSKETRKLRKCPPKIKTNDHVALVSKTNNKAKEDEKILEKHVQQTGEKSAKFVRLVCDICSQEEATFLKLRKHMELEHQVKGYALLLKHANKHKHLNPDCYKCKDCEKVIADRKCARHQLEHAGVVLPKVRCDKCGSWHKDKYCLRKHKRQHNDEGKELVCNICGKVSPNRIALQSHQRDVHLSERTFECSVCKKAFKKATSLKAHMALHTGEVLHRCPHCPKTFNSNAAMHLHGKKCH